MNRNRKRAVTALAVFLLFMGACTIAAKGIYKNGLARVTVVLPERSRLSETVKCSGSVVPGQEYGVYVEPGLRVYTVYVAQGQQVEAGEELFKVDEEDLKAHIVEGEAQQKLLEAQLADLREKENAREKEQELTCKRMQEDYDDLVAAQDITVENSRLAWEGAKQELERLQNRMQGDISGGDAETAAEEEAVLKLREQQAYQEYRNAQLQKEEALRGWKRQLEDAQAEGIKESAARVELENHLAEVKADLQKLYALQEAQCMVRAPENGMILSCMVRTGERTCDGACVLYEAAGGAGIVEIPLNEKMAGILSLGDKVTLSYKNVSGEHKKFTAPISYLQKTDGGTVAQFFPEGEELLSGQTVQMEYTYESESYSLVLPLAAIHQGDMGESYIYLVEEQEGILGVEERIRKYMVSVLEQNDQYAAVHGSALTAESRVVFSANQEIAEGDAVRVVGSGAG